MSRAQTALSAALAAFAAASLWLSFGLVAVTGLDTSARVVALPPLWLLGLLVAAATAAVAVLTPTPRHLAPLLGTALVWLPFVPGHIPAWCLAWHGPIEVAVWGLVLVQLVGRRWPLPSRSWPTRPPGWRAKPSAPVGTPLGILADKHMNEAGRWMQLKVGDKAFNVPKMPFAMSGTQDFEAAKQPAFLGEHTDDILASLGYAQADIDALKAEKVVLRSKQMLNIDGPAE